MEPAIEHAMHDERVGSVQPPVVTPEVPDLSASARIPIDQVTPDPNQPRTHIDKNDIERLATSIRHNGVLQPILVREVGPNQYVIIAGERRYRAAVAAGLDRIPAIRVRSDSEAGFDAYIGRKLALIENLQREDLNPLDAALAILEHLQQTLGYGSHDDVAKLLRRMKNGTTKPADTADAQRVMGVFEELGKNWRSFTNTEIALLGFYPDLREQVRLGTLEVTKARVLNAVEDEELRRHLTQRTIDEPLSRAEIEREVQAGTARGEQGDEARRQEVLGTFNAIQRKYKKASLPPEKLAEIERTLARLNELLDSST